MASCGDGLQPALSVFGVGACSNDAHADLCASRLVERRPSEQHVIIGDKRDTTMSRSQPSDASSRYDSSE
jgi:hypothetical protein